MEIQRGIFRYGAQQQNMKQNTMTMNRQGVHSRKQKTHTPRVRRRTIMSLMELAILKTGELVTIVKTDPIQSCASSSVSVSVSLILE